MARPPVYGIDSWYDDICKIWGTISVNKMNIRSYLLKDIPESVKEYPCAISFIEEVDSNYSVGGGANGFYSGRTEFHIVGSVAKSQLGFVMKFIDPIIAAAAKNMTLGGKVTDFHLVKKGSVKPVLLTWGSEIEHFGLVVPWTVEENQSGKFTVSA